MMDNGMDADENCSHGEDISLACWCYDSDCSYLEHYEEEVDCGCEDWDDECYNACYDIEVEDGANGEVWLMDEVWSWSDTHNADVTDGLLIMYWDGETGTVCDDITSETDEGFY